MLPCSHYDVICNVESGRFCATRGCCNKGTAGEWRTSSKLTTFPMLRWWKNVHLWSTTDPAVFVYSSPLSSGQVRLHADTSCACLFYPCGTGSEIGFELLCGAHTSLYMRSDTMKKETRMRTRRLTPCAVLQLHAALAAHAAFYRQASSASVVNDPFPRGWGGPAARWLNMWPSPGMLLVCLLCAGFPFWSSEVGGFIFVE